MVYPAAPRSVRLQALLDLRSLMESIQEADGYRTSVRWCDLAMTHDLALGSELPAVAIVWDQTGISMQTTCDCVQEVVPVAIFAAVQGSPRVGERHPNDDQLTRLDWITTDILVALGRDPSLGTPDVVCTRIVSQETFPAGEGHGEAYVRIGIEIDLQYLITDPTLAH